MDATRPFRALGHLLHLNHTPVSARRAVAAEVPAATVHFEDGWKEEVVGDLKAGGTLTVDTTLTRMLGLKNPDGSLVLGQDGQPVQPGWAYEGSHNGYPTWGAQAIVKFEPSNQVVSQDIIKFQQISPGDNLGAKAYTVPATVAIPEGTTGVQVWFESEAYGQGQAVIGWDTNPYDRNADGTRGVNYHFPVK